MAQIFALSEASVLVGLINNRLEGMDLSDKEVHLLEGIRSKVLANIVPDRQEFLYHFTDGGWNSEYATSKAQAYKQAVKRWGKDSDLAARVDKNSFRVSTPGDYNNLMSLFY